MSKETRAARRSATREDKEAFRRADRALQENGRREKKAGIRHETEEFLRLNREVDRLGRKIGKWR
jgi:hypothetical protein